jgi:hypothetical protein
MGSNIRDDEDMETLAAVELGLAVLGALISFKAIWELVQRWYAHGVGSRRHWQGQLDQLANGTTDEYMNGLLGTPVFKKNMTLGVGTDGETKHFIDRIFSTPHAWVVTRSEDGRVAAWSVTITDPEFWWEISLVTFGEASGRLGRASFTKLLSRSDGQYLSNGAHDFVFAEAAYYGSPAGYQTFVYMHNQGGTGGFYAREPGTARSGLFAAEDETGQSLELVDRCVLQRTTVNTIIVSLAVASFHTLDWGFWPTVSTTETKLLHRSRKKRIKT